MLYHNKIRYVDRDAFPENFAKRKTCSFFYKKYRSVLNLHKRHSLYKTYWYFLIDPNLKFDSLLNFRLFDLMRFRSNNKLYLLFSQIIDTIRLSKEQSSLNLNWITNYVWRLYKTSVKKRIENIHHSLFRYVLIGHEGLWRLDLIAVDAIASSRML